MKQTSPSPPVRKKARWFILAGGLLLAAGLIITRTMPPVKNAPQESLPASPATNRTGLESKPLTPKTNPPEHATNALPETTPPHAKAAGSRTVSPAIAQAFPGLAEVLNDWREFRPNEITVAPHPDLPLTFTQIALKDEGRYVTWIGRNPALPGASFVGVATANGYDAILVVPGSSQFSFHVRGDTLLIEESAPGEESCGVDPVQPARPALAAAPSNFQIDYPPGYNPDAAILAATPALNVDVLFGYDAATLEEAAAKSSDPAGYIDGRCKAMIESSNIALSQSGVSNFAWRYVGVLAAPAYTRTGLLSDDLKAIAAGGPLERWVNTRRYEHGADQFVLLVSGPADFGGKAFLRTQTATSRGNSLAVMLWSNSSQTLTHELAHNFGCRHDRTHAYAVSLTDPGQPAPDNDGFWCYGQMWQNPLPAGYTGDPGTGGTIMSYADWRIPYFSNPTISVRLTGSLLGWKVNPFLGDYQIGRAVTAPDAAYNARVLSEQAQTMSNHHEEIVFPAITQHPQPTTVARGQTFTLQVTATGGGLIYKWMKNGVAISGAAPNASYSAVADTSDSDTYSVTASNLRGEVTSNTAVVTVTAPPPAGGSGNSGGSSGGGSGGGGSLSGWFCGALLFLLMARRAGLKKPGALPP